MKRFFKVMSSLIIVISLTLNLTPNTFLEDPVISFKQIADIKVEL